MKRLFFLLLFVSLLLLAGCAKDSRSLLWYQDGFSAAVLEKDGIVWEITPRTDGVSVTILAPDTLAGITWCFSGDTVFLETGTLRLPVTEAMTETPRSLLSLFHLAEEDLLSLKAAETGTEARFSGEDGEILITFRDGGLPLSFHTPFGDCLVRELRFPEGTPG